MILRTDLRFSGRIWQAAILLLLLVDVTLQAKKQMAVVSDVNDIKEFKKLLRTKTNVLVLFVNVPKSAKSVTNVFKETADVMKGQATLVLIDCNNGDSKKLCKKLKVGTEKTYYMKHYKDGDFHKDYDRSETLASMSNFLRDPTGDLPWEEDPEAADVFHLQDAEALTKFLRKSAAAYKRSMIMFYAPWCGYCKVMKPEYVQAAGDLKGDALLAAMDVSKSGNSKIRQHYNITGFPTLLYYDKGQLRFPYNGDNKRQAIVDFMKEPVAQVQPKKEAADESWSPDTDVLHLTGESFDSSLGSAEHALVVFYAPWCGHCKRIKPELEKAATRLKKDGMNGILAAVDATKEPSLAARFGVKGYPTIKYFSRGEFQYDAGHARTEDQIVGFIQSPQEPPPPPPPQKPWAEEESHVRHLDASTFRSSLRKVKHALVMFYAPWCGHCKSTKPEFVKAAAAFADELMVAFGAVDCTLEKDLCAAHGVTGYPSLKYFSYFDKATKDYNGGRKEADFVSFVGGVMGSSLSQKAKTGADSGFGVSVQFADDETFEKIIASPTPTIVMFYAVWCTYCQAVKPSFSKLATTLKNDNSAVAVAVDAAENPKVADLAGITTLPTFKIYASGKLLSDYDGERSYDDLLSFTKKFTVGKDEL